MSANLRLVFGSYFRQAPINIDYIFAWRKRRYCWKKLMTLLTKLLQKLVSTLTVALVQLLEKPSILLRQNTEISKLPKSIRDIFWEISANVEKSTSSTFWSLYRTR